MISIKHITAITIILVVAFSAKTITPRDDDIFKLESIDKDQNNLISFEEFKGFIQNLSILNEHYSAQ